MLLIDKYVVEKVNINDMGEIKNTPESIPFRS